MFANYRYHWKKGNKKLLKKIAIFPLLKTCTINNHLTHISVCLPKFDIKKLEPQEFKKAQLLCKKLYKQGYQTDLQTLSLFALLKKKSAYPCIKRFISYCENMQNRASNHGILDYISSGHFVGIGKQLDGMMVLELFSKQLDMQKCCVYSLINVLLTNIFQHLTYEATKKGLIVVIDNLGFNLRLWHDRKFFYVFKVLGCIFDFAAIVNVDTSKRFANLFRGFFKSVKLTDVQYMVRRSDNLRGNIFRQAVWSEVVWGGKQLPLFQKIFPNIMLSKQFGGSNVHLLKLYTAKESMLKSFLKFRKGDLINHEYEDESKNGGSCMTSSQLCGTPPLKNVNNYIDCESKAICDNSSVMANISRMVPIVPSIELSIIPELYSVKSENSSSTYLSF